MQKFVHFWVSHRSLRRELAKGMVVTQRLVQNFAEVISQTEKRISFFDIFLQVFLHRTIQYALRRENESKRSLAIWRKRRASVPQLGHGLDRPHTGFPEDLRRRSARAEDKAGIV